MVLLVLLAFWIMLACLVAKVGERKAGGSFVWFICSLFFGPIALLVVLIAPYDPARAAKPGAR